MNKKVSLVKLPLLILAVNCLFIQKPAVAFASSVIREIGNAEHHTGFTVKDKKAQNEMENIMDSKST